MTGQRHNPRVECWCGLTHAPWREPQPAEGPDYHADHSFWRDTAAALVRAHQLEKPLYWVKLARGCVTHWNDQPLTTRDQAESACHQIEKVTGEKGEVESVYA